MNRMCESMIDVNTSNTYEYKGYYIIDNIESGLWTIVDYNYNEIGNFSTSDEAEYYINNLLSAYMGTSKDTYQEVEMNDLPIKSYTYRKLIKSKYKTCSGIAYVLRSEYGNNKYKCYSTITYLGSFSNDNLLIFKSIKAARASRDMSKSNYSIVVVRFSNGIIKLI